MLETIEKVLNGALILIRDSGERKKPEPEAFSMFCADKSFCALPQVGLSVWGKSDTGIHPIS